MQQRTAERIFYNGKIITLDRSSTICSALATAGERILATGADDYIRTLAGPGTERVDLRGRAVIPGLIDGHAHMDREGLKDVYPSLAGARSIDDILARIAALVRRARPGEWIVTMPIGEPPSYWDLPESLAEKRWPTRHDLDSVAPDNPVYIRPIWGFWRHKLPLVSIANTRALAECGIGRDTVSPVESVIIEKDSSGAPTGIFTEWTYMSVVELTLMRRAGGFTAEQRAAALRRSMAAYNAFGTTSVFEEHGVAGEVLAAYRTLREAGPLPVRAHLIHSPSWGAVADVPIGSLLDGWGAWLAGRGLGDDYLRIAGLYVLLEDEGDGPRSPAENALRASASPYTGWAGFHYDAGLPRDRLREVLLEAARQDIRCVGLTPDLLDLYAEVDRKVPIADKRWVLGHISLLTRDQIARARDLGLVLTTHTNRYIFRTGSRVLAEIGAEREDEISPLASLRDAGIRFALATDNVPVSMFHPIWQSIARRDRATGRVIAPAEKIGREDALRAATIDGAYLTFEENDKGSLEPGKLADLVALSDDPLRVDEERIRDIAAELVVVGGRTVYEREGAAAKTRPASVAAQ
ncbi:MAG TPA: amidohydrolase [Alphaproteobacteria bacterium]|jgi:predicted amidohydrolase YtcJ|nr:amidohydrolase [Alphaproteobacteria bacterium]